MGPFRDLPTDVLGAGAWLQSARRVPRVQMVLEPEVPPSHHGLRLPVLSPRDQK